MTAKDLKNLAAQVRRTDTALRQLAWRLDLGEHERHALLAAAAVLDSSGRRVRAEATQAKRAEDAREKAIVKGTLEAMTLLADWPAATTLDKVALCIVAGLEAHLREDIGREQTDLAWCLDYWLKQARRDIPAETAWQSWRQGKPVLTIMAQAREKLEWIRTQPGTMALAERWQTELDAQASSA
ncbi:MAG: hypothetical protein AB1768_10535 [Pseudomonadota bacterium]|jgi:hypothetical protein